MGEESRSNLIVYNGGGMWRKKFSANSFLKYTPGYSVYMCAMDEATSKPSIPSIVPVESSSDLPEGNNTLTYLPAVKLANGCIAHKIPDVDMHYGDVDYIGATDTADAMRKITIWLEESRSNLIVYNDGGGMWRKKFSANSRLKYTPGYSVYMCAMDEATSKQSILSNVALEPSSNPPEGNNALTYLPAVKLANGCIANKIPDVDMHYGNVDYIGATDTADAMKKIVIWLEQSLRYHNLIVYNGGGMWRKRFSVSSRLKYVPGSSVYICAMDK